MQNWVGWAGEAGSQVGGIRDQGGCAVDRFIRSGKSLFDDGNSGLMGRWVDGWMGGCGDETVRVWLIATGSLSRGGRHHGNCLLSVEGRGWQEAASIREERA